MKLFSRRTDNSLHNSRQVAKCPANLVHGIAGTKPSTRYDSLVSDFKAHKKLVPMQPGDVPTTYADATALERDFGFTPKIPLREGLRKFAEWYASFYMSKD